MKKVLRTYPVPRAQSCATCTHWRLEGKPRARAWCPRAAAWLPTDLTRCGCMFWAKEQVETQALEVYEQLVNSNE